MGGVGGLVLDKCLRSQQQQWNGIIVLYSNRPTPNYSTTSNQTSTRSHTPYHTINTTSQTSTTPKSKQKKTNNYPPLPPPSPRLSPSIENHVTSHSPLPSGRALGSLYTQPRLHNDISNRTEPETFSAGSLFVLQARFL